MKSKKKSGSKLWLWVGFALLNVVLIAGTIGLTMMLVKGKKPSVATPEAGAPTSGASSSTSSSTASAASTNSAPSPVPSSPPSTPSATAAAPSLPSVAPPGQPTTPDWLQVMTDIDARREKAYATGDIALLKSLYTPGSRAGDMDVQALHNMVNHGWTAQGFAHPLVRVEVASATADSTQLRITDTLKDHTIVSSRGASSRVKGGRGEKTWLVTLKNINGGWLIDQWTTAG